MGQLSVSFSNTATSPETGARMDVLPAPINWNADWRVVETKPGEVIMTNIGAPMDQPEKIRVAFSEIADVYKGTGIIPNPNTITYSKKGISLLVQYTCVGTDSDNPDGVFPVSAHLVLKLPAGVEADGATIGQIIGRVLGSLYETKATLMDTRTSSLLRGALVPTDL